MPALPEFRFYLSILMGQKMKKLIKSKNKKDSKSHGAIDDDSFGGEEFTSDSGLLGGGSLRPEPKSSNTYTYRRAKS